MTDATKKKKNDFSGKPRMAREYKTIKTMIRIYCHDHHGTTESPCPDCRELLDYARLRLIHCPFQEKKTSCGNCTVHCYKPAMREKIREVMRYVGPRMIFRHPIMALFHILDGLRKQPDRPVKKRT
ncbi:MAG: nitrous oxide-stimulated promoter family protein [Thermodesulfobacteriota bacterium]|nr:nitrous oxide-stimulated promoter family protein [Thermodesulfobacteriota bacterium]